LELRICGDINLYMFCEDFTEYLAIIKSETIRKILRRLL